MKTEHPNQNGPGKSGSAWKWALCGFLAIITFFLIAEHQAHLFRILPFLLLAACPLMHVFMHKDHGGHGGDSDRNAQEPDQHKH